MINEASILARAEKCKLQLICKTRSGKYIFSKNDLDIEVNPEDNSFIISYWPQDFLLKLRTEKFVPFVEDGQYNLFEPTFEEAERAAKVIKGLQSLEKD